MDRVWAHDRESDPLDASDAHIFSIGLVEGMAHAGPAHSSSRVIRRRKRQWGRFADQFGTAHKAFFIMGDSMTYDFGRLAPLEFAFIDGAPSIWSMF